MGPLNLLESIAEVPDRQVAKRANHLSSDFLSSVSVAVSQASTITSEAITTIQLRKKKHHKQGFALTTYRSQRTQTDWSVISRTPMCLYACLYTPFF